MKMFLGLPPSVKRRLSLCHFVIQPTQPVYSVNLFFPSVGDSSSDVSKETRGIYQDGERDEERVVQRSVVKDELEGITSGTGL